MACFESIHVSKFLCTEIFENDSNATGFSLDPLTVGCEFSFFAEIMVKVFQLRKNFSIHKSFLRKEMKCIDKCSALIIIQHCFDNILVRLLLCVIISNIVVRKYKRKQSNKNKICTNLNIIIRVLKYPY